MSRDSVKYKGLVLGLWAIVLCSVNSSTGGTPTEVEKLRSAQFVTEDVFLSITNGSTFAEVRKTLGNAVRHEFTVADQGHTWMLIMCFLHTGPEESYNFYQLLFCDGSLVKTIGWIQFERETYPYRGTTATRSKPWDIEDIKYVRMALDAPAVTAEQARAELKRTREAMEKYKGQGNIPAVVGYVFAPAFLAKAKKEYPINEKMRQKFDGCRASVGMTLKEVDALFGEPLHNFATKTERVVRIYGDDVYVGTGVDALLVFSYVAVLFDAEGYAAAIYSDAFLCKDWYPGMPSWRRH